MPKYIIKKNSFEQTAWQHNKLVCGIDEVGRGCLAGPVVVAAVMLPAHTKKRGLQDSKLLTEEQREQTYAWIVKHCQYAVTWVDHHTIDTINIYQATKKAMYQALAQLAQQHNSVQQQIEAVLIDAVKLTLPPAYQAATLHAYPQGEHWSSSIAAASIVAKVTRDRFMRQIIGPLFPCYDFAAHKGYGTPTHQKALKKYGPTAIHRISFLKQEQSDEQQQISLL